MGRFSSPVCRTLMFQRHLIAFLTLLCLVPTAAAAEPFRYPEGRHGAGELRYINGLPVLRVEGTPEEIGEQTAALTARSVGPLLDYPRNYLRQHGREALWPGLVSVGRTMLGQLPGGLSPGAGSRREAVGRRSRPADRRQHDVRREEDRRLLDADRRAGPQHDRRAAVRPQPRLSHAGHPGEVQPGDRLPAAKASTPSPASASPACSAACRA